MRIGGQIAGYNLVELWCSLSEPDRVAIASRVIGGVESIIGGPPTRSNRDAHFVVANYASMAQAAKAHEAARTLYEWALKCPAERPLDGHFTICAASDFYYKMRDVWPEAISRCRQLCEEHMTRWEEFRDLWNFQFSDSDGNVEMKCRGPTTVCRLAILLEKKGEITKAITVVEYAKSLGFEEDTKSGFEGRIEKLKRKLDLS